MTLQIISNQTGQVLYKNMTKRDATRLYMRLTRCGIPCRLEEENTALYSAFRIHQEYLLEIQQNSTLDRIRELIEAGKIMLPRPMTYKHKYEQYKKD